MRYLAACTLTLVLAASSAHGFGGWLRGGASRSYYPVASYCPVYVMPAVAAVPCYPVAPTTPRVIPLAPPIPFAPPRSAPPSKDTKEPPLGKTMEPPLGTTTEKRAPTIVESRSPSVVPALAKDHCKVGFWNLTGRDLEINVAGKTRTLPKDQALTLELDRQFTWNLVGQPPASERVADDRPFHEIILRE
jgi:hypothetical protein